MSTMADIIFLTIWAIIDLFVVYLHFKDMRRLDAEIEERDKVKGDEQR